MRDPKLSVIILAAGKGTRMKSTKAKVLHHVFFDSMINHVVRATNPLQASQTIIIVGHQKDSVKNELAGHQLEFATQKEQLGTGHAVLMAKEILESEDSTVMILCGDTPLIRSETLSHLFELHLKNQRAVTILTTILDDPTHYGRIISNKRGEVSRIVEHKDATDTQLDVKEVNAGIYCVESKFLFSALEKVDTNNSQGEVYLTDIVQIAVDEGLSVGKYITADSNEIQGVNSRLQLATAQQEFQRRRNTQLLEAGVSIHDTASVQISLDSNIGTDTVVEFGVKISGESSIGKTCIIGQGTIIHNCVLNDDVEIGPYSCLTNQTIDKNNQLPPYSHRI